MVKEGEKNISCFLSYKRYIFNDMYVCTYAYPERREDIWIGRVLYNGGKGWRKLWETKYEQSTAIYMYEMIQWNLLFYILK